VKCRPIAFILALVITETCCRAGLICQKIIIEPWNSDICADLKMLFFVPTPGPTRTSHGILHLAQKYAAFHRKEEEDCQFPGSCEQFNLFPNSPASYSNCKVSWGMDSLKSW